MNTPEIVSGIPDLERELLQPTIDEIELLKTQRNAVVLAHNYMTPDIYHTVADFRGDSLQLAREAGRTGADVVVMAGVHFMAETVKILNPSCTVLIPDDEAGCSLADAVTADAVRAARALYPGMPAVAYVNTSAAVKAEVDVCCTSSNAVRVVESLNADQVLFLPDRYLGSWVASQLPDVDLVLWNGACEVHARFTGDELREYRSGFVDISLIAHPECPPDVLAEADFVGSTAAMIAWVDEHRPTRVAMITECSMSDNIASEFPDVEFVRPCNLCPYMKRITLQGILDSLRDLTHEVVVDRDIAPLARKSIERMLAVV